MRSIREINNIDELADIRSDWNALLEQTPGATFFQTLDWLEVYWRHWEDSQQLRTLLVYDAETLIGIVPLAVKPNKASFSEVFLELRGYPGVSIGKHPARQDKARNNFKINMKNKFS